MNSKLKTRIFEIDANGEITYGVFPGNIKFGFSGNAVCRADGTQSQRVGIQPIIKVAPTICGIVEGSDEILTAAVNFLRTKP